MTIHRTAIRLRLFQTLCFVVIVCCWTPPVYSVPPVKEASLIGTPSLHVRISASSARSSNSQTADDRPDVIRRSPIRLAVRTVRRTAEKTARTHVTDQNQFVHSTVTQTPDHWNLPSATVDGSVSMQSNADYLQPVPMSDLRPVLSRAPINAPRVAEAVR
ncbi:MAG: hypothetical protein JNL58_06800 [Planctomyces sp.]|nr:hypothetical protein [Planctomyces sp.]